MYHAFDHSPRPRPDQEDALSRFVSYATVMLEPSTTESRRRQLEPHLLDLLPVLKAMGVFELFAVRHPGLRAMIEDELPGPHTDTSR